MLPGKPSDWRDLLFRKLLCSASLGKADFAGIETLMHRSRTLQADDVIEARPGTMGVLASGACYRYRLLEDGRRVVFNIWLPGDPFYLAPTTPGVEMSIAASDRAELIMISSAQFRKLCTASPILADAFVANERLESMLLAGHVMRLARFTAYERVSHFLLEIWDRVSIVDLAQNGRIPFSLTQVLLADALGLTNVHISRTLKRLREEGLIEINQQKFRLSDVDTLADLCEYEWIVRNTPQAE